MRDWISVEPTDGLKSVIWLGQYLANLLHRAAASIRMELKRAASGIDSPSDEHDCRSSFEEMGFPHERLLVLNDCEVFLHLTETPSLVVISGTGSVCFGRDTKGNIYRTGGWNHILSDEGSAFDLGLKVLRAAADEFTLNKNEGQALFSFAEMGKCAKNVCANCTFYLQLYDIFSKISS